MKKCPTCGKTFEDSMRFCQADGTPLVDEAPAPEPEEAVEEEAAFDPYATIVGTAASFTPPPDDPPAEEPAPEDPAPEAEAEPMSEADSEAGDAAENDPAVHMTVGSMPIAPPEDVLDLPTNDPLKTMYVSDTEMQETLGKSESEDDASDVMDIPPMAESPAPEPPSFIAPPAPEPEAPTEPDAPDEPAVAAAEPEATTPPPSPFAVPDMPISPGGEDDFDEAATMIQSSPSFDRPEPEPAPPASSPFDMPPPAPSVFEPPPPAPVEQWTPPPAPDENWQGQEIGQNTPFQPPAANVEGQSKTLAIVSLILGILGFLCCSSTFVVGLAAIVTGFMARGKANSDPANFGGSGMAMGGIILGVISLLIGAGYWILVVTGTIALPNF
ncbi:MAG: DUF4190 domain-containing protein [Pyrinomonadaceae bacterium]